MEDLPGPPQDPEEAVSITAKLGTFTLAEQKKGPQRKFAVRELSVNNAEGDTKTRQTS